MTYLSVREIHEFSTALVAIEYTDDVRELLGPLENSELSVKEVTRRVNDLAAAIPHSNQ